MKWISVAVLLVLAGCGSRQPAANDVQAQCRSQAYADPKVKQQIIAGMGQSGVNPQQQFDYDKALYDATQACLRQHGVAVRGGVEPVRPY